MRAQFVRVNPISALGCESKVYVLIVRLVLKERSLKRLHSR
jgi:hypothetical protein